MNRLFHFPVAVGGMGARSIADGCFEHSDLLQSSLYGCTMTIFRWQRGNAAIAGDHITLTPDEGTVRSKKNCGAALDDVRAHGDAAETYTFQIESQDGRAVLVMKKQSGEDWGRFYRQ